MACGEEDAKEVFRLNCLEGKGSQAGSGVPKTRGVSWLLLFCCCWIIWGDFIFFVPWMVFRASFANRMYPSTSPLLSYRVFIGQARSLPSILFLQVNVGQCISMWLRHWFFFFLLSFLIIFIWKKGLHSLSWISFVCHALSTLSFNSPQYPSRGYLGFIKEGLKLVSQVWPRL